MDCFAILGLSRNVTRDEVRKAYFELARRYHPDKGKSSSGEAMKTINKAYEDALRILDSRNAHMAYAVSNPGYTNYQDPSPVCGGHRNSGYPPRHNANPDYGSSRTTTPGYTTIYTTARPSHRGGRASEYDYASHSGTRTNGPSSAFGASRTGEILQFHEFSGSRSETRSNYCESDRISRCTRSGLPDWVRRSEQVRRQALEDAEDALQDARRGSCYGYGGDDLDALTRKVKHARSELERHLEWVEEGLEYGYDFDDVSFRR